MSLLFTPAALPSGGRNLVLSARCPHDSTPSLNPPQIRHGKRYAAGHSWASVVSVEKWRRRHRSQSPMEKGHFPQTSTEPVKPLEWPAFRIVLVCLARRISNRLKPGVCRGHRPISEPWWSRGRPGKILLFSKRGGADARGISSRKGANMRGLFTHLDYLNLQSRKREISNWKHS
jgi:hypothetical protein